MENPFNYRHAARRYAQSRLRIHGTALRAFREACGAGAGFSNALDVACGTGHSSSALAQFPTPPRESTPISARLARAHGFELVGSREFEDWIALSRNELIAYFSTQSNVVLAVERGGLCYEAAEAAIDGIVSPFFDRDRQQFRFPGIVWFMIKRGSA